MHIVTKIAFALLSVGAVACGGGGGGGGGGGQIVLPVAFDVANFSGHAIDNPFFPLTPGTTYVYEGATADGLEHEIVQVTVQTKIILGVTCVVVHQTASLDGSLIENTLDWYAQDDAGNVWYFGEATEEISGGVVVGTEGSWEGGVDGAQAGIQMLAAPAAGDIYSQEFALDVAEDLARVVATGETVALGIGTYPGCVHTEDTTPLEPAIRENKFYAAGVGTILEIDENGVHHELVSVTP